MKRKLELSEDAKKAAIGEIQSYFLSERDEEISPFQAERWLDFFLEKLAPRIYNQAINDAHQLMSGYVEDLFTLEKRAR